MKAGIQNIPIPVRMMDDPHSTSDFVDKSHILALDIHSKDKTTSLTDSGAVPSLLSIFYKSALTIS